MGAVSFVADGLDLSERGVSFRTQHVLPLDAEVLLRYRLEDDGPTISARVRICHYTAGRYGTMFLTRRATHIAAQND